MFGCKWLNAFFFSGLENPAPHFILDLFFIVPDSYYQMHDMFLHICVKWLTGMTLANLETVTTFCPLVCVICDTEPKNPLQGVVKKGGCLFVMLKVYYPRELIGFFLIFQVCSTENISHGQGCSFGKYKIALANLKKCKNTTRRFN